MPSRDQRVDFRVVPIAWRCSPRQTQIPLKKRMKAKLMLARIAAWTGPFGTRISAGPVPVVPSALDVLVLVQTVPAPVPSPPIAY
ncbi:MAG TPA: hypothetical protein VFQ54_08990 [Thermomicrobiales bacterium]|nr:hypothetical protein [Thermomicrobiales bacterium]